MADRDLIAFLERVHSDAKRLHAALTATAPSAERESQGAGELSKNERDHIIGTIRKTCSADLADRLSAALAAAPKDAATQPKADAWPGYIAGMIETYLQSNPAADVRERAITGIIERRMCFAPPAASLREQEWDYEPQLTAVEHGAEPSLRKIVKHYYSSHGIESTKADKLTAQYIDAQRLGHGKENGNG
jgi:hypothetical protein